MTARLFMDPETGRQILLDPDDCPDVKGRPMTPEPADVTAGHLPRGKVVSNPCLI